MRHNRKKKELIRRMETSRVRKDNTKEGDLKTRAVEISEARSKPLSVASNIVLREEQQSRTREPGFSGYFRQKHGDSPSLAKLPTDEAEAKRFAVMNLKPAGKPEFAYPGSVAD